MDFRFEIIQMLLGSDDWKLGYNVALICIKIQWHDWRRKCLLLPKEISSSCLWWCSCSPFQLLCVRSRLLLFDFVPFVFGDMSFYFALQVWFYFITFRYLLPFILFILIPVSMYFNITLLSMQTLSCIDLFLYYLCINRQAIRI